MKHSSDPSPPPFDPPFESPLEEEFAWAISKYLDPSVRFEKQVELVTKYGTFRIDFVAFHQGARIGFECDGEEFHDPFHDECRDALILGEGHLEAVYRIRGKDIHHHLDDCLYLISCSDTILFSKRGCANLRVLASAEAKQASAPIGDTAYLAYRDSAFSVVLERRSRHVPGGERRHWQFLYSYAVENDVKSVDELVQLRKADFKKAARS